MLPISKALGIRKFLAQGITTRRFPYTGSASFQAMTWLAGQSHLSTNHISVYYEYAHHFICVKSSSRPSKSQHKKARKLLKSKFTSFFIRMRSRGLEPPRGLAHTDLNRARLPIPPRPRIMFIAFRRQALISGDKIYNITPGKSSQHFF